MASRSWRSSDVAVPDQFAFWADTVQEVFGSMAVERDSEGPFEMSIVQTTMGALTLSSVHAGEHRSVRTAEMARRRPSGMVHVAVPRAGQLRGTHSSDVVVSRAGWLGMVRGDAPATLTATSAFDQLVVGIPAELVVPRMADPDAVGATGALPALLGSTAVHLFEHAAMFDRADAARATEHVADLTVACFGAIGRRTPRAVALQAVMDEAERRLRDPALDIESLARHANVSRRTLEKLFADRGLSASRWIRGRRLERSRSELRDARLADLSVEQVAMRWGFADRTHFTRVYRERFGIPPGAERRHPSP